MEYAKRKDVSLEQLEKEVLQGQQLQGLKTLHGVHAILEHNGITQRFPLFEALFAIFFQKSPIVRLFDI